MAALTPEQVAKLLQIIRDASTAIAIQTAGHVVPPEEIERLIKEGYLSAEGQPTNLISDAFTFGQLMHQAQGAKGLTYDQFRKQLAANPLPMSVAEKYAQDVATRRAGMYCRGLGNRFSEELGRTLINADQELATKTRRQIADATANNIAKRESVGKLRTDLRQLTQEFKRDWDRVAHTETHQAHQEGFLNAVSEEYGEDEQLAKIPEADACEHCRRLLLENGKPKVRPASWWAANGTSNAGRKQNEWLAVVGAIHPWCRCPLVRVPKGWGFNAAWNLVPLSMIDDDTEKSETVHKHSGTCGCEEPLEKARKLHGRMKFQGFDISIENAAGSKRHWYDTGKGEYGTTTMLLPYGYIRGTEGTDGDHVDVYVGPNEDAKKVYVVHQQKAPKFDRHDEDKVFLGMDSAAAAKGMYLKHYNDPRFYGGMTVMTLERFRKRVFEAKGEILKSMPAESYGGWEAAIARAGLPAAKVALVLKFARQGHAGARALIERANAELAKSSMPFLAGTANPIGTMGLHSKPAKTTTGAGEHINPPQDWTFDTRPKGRKKRKIKRGDELRAMSKQPTVKGADKPHNMEDLTITSDPVDVSPSVARLAVEAHQRSRAELTAGNHLTTVDIHT